MTDSPCLLVVEDDAPTRTFLADNLTADGYELLVADSVRDALRQLEYHHVDLAVVDVGLSDGSGLDVVAAVRAATGAGARLDARLPIVLLSGRAADIDRVRGFERGADDFVPKPFSYAEFRLRIAAVLRRSRERRAGGRLRVGDLAIDPASREVLLRGETVALSQKEFALLSALAAEPTRVFTKAELLRDVWGFRAMGSTRTLDSHASRKVRESKMEPRARAWCARKRRRSTWDRPRSSVRSQGPGTRCETPAVNDCPRKHAANVAERWAEGCAHRSVARRDDTLRGSAREPARPRPRAGGAVAPLGRNAGGRRVRGRHRRRDRPWAP